MDIGSRMRLADNSLMDFVKSSIADEKAVRLQEREFKKMQQENILKEKKIQADSERHKLAAERDKLAADLADKQRNKDRNYQLKIMQLQNDREIAEQRIRSENERLQVESETRVRIAESASRTSATEYVDRGHHQ